MSRVNSKAPPACDSASAGMVEDAIKLGTEKVRTLLTAVRELHGVVIGPEHVALA